MLKAVGNDAEVYHNASNFRTQIGQKALTATNYDVGSAIWATLGWRPSIVQWKVAIKNQILCCVLEVGASSTSARHFIKQLESRHNQKIC